MRSVRRIALTGMLLLAGSVMYAEELDPVDLELIIAIDESGSVDLDEYARQLEGSAAAFRDSRVQEAIRSGPYGAIAVTVVSWSEEGWNEVRIPWMKVYDRDSAEMLAQALPTLARNLNAGRMTNISALIDFAVPLFGERFRGTRRVLDISGDSGSTTNPLARGSRDRAVKAGVTINGLVILPAIPLDYRPVLYYKEEVIGGPGHFLMVSLGADNYAEVVLRKLLQEIPVAVGSEEAPGGT